METENWRNLAYCKGRATSEFYPEFGVKGAIDQVRKTKSFCRRCPVILDCLQYAIDNDEQFGIWGGLTPKERSNMRKPKRNSIIETIVKVVRKNDSHEV